MTTSRELDLDRSQAHADQMYHGRTDQPDYSVWNSMARQLGEPISNDKYKWGRVRFTLDAFDVDPGITSDNGPEFHDRVMKARLYLLDRWQKRIARQ